MKKIVFICRANLVRSQISEALFNLNPVPGWEAYSYGVSVDDLDLQGSKLSEYGKGIFFQIDELLKIGVDISENYCKQIKPELLAEFDKVIVMSEIEWTPKWLMEKSEWWDIPNPNPMTRDSIIRTINLLKAKIEELKASLK